MTLKKLKDQRKLLGTIEKKGWIIDVKEDTVVVSSGSDVPSRPSATKITKTSAPNIKVAVNGSDVPSRPANKIISTNTKNVKVSVSKGSPIKSDRISNVTNTNKQVTKVCKTSADSRPEININHKASGKKVYK